MVEGHNRVLITLGPTIEYWDTVRFLTNRSSGRTGIAIALAAVNSGFEVTVITSLKISIDNCTVINIESAEDMFSAVKNEISYADIFISAAAVADFRPVRQQKKVKKCDSNFCHVIKLERTPDILRWVGSQQYSDKIIVGFSLEDTADIRSARDKMKSKRCDIMISNTTSNLASDIKSFTVVCENGEQNYNNVSTEEMAELIIKHVSGFKEKYS